ncbi:hypothetical protein LTR17_019139 [Elasticomyces elasticus]|nr:hypothetical protein LTR17_019139 [Elasticomyces elasticus]
MKLTPQITYLANPDDYQVRDDDECEPYVQRERTCIHIDPDAPCYNCITGTGNKVERGIARACRSRKDGIRRKLDLRYFIVKGTEMEDDITIERNPDVPDFAFIDSMRQKGYRPKGDGDRIFRAPAADSNDNSDASSDEELLARKTITTEDRANVREKLRNIDLGIFLVAANAFAVYRNLATSPVPNTRA